MEGRREEGKRRRGGGGRGGGAGGGAAAGGVAAELLEGNAKWAGAEGWAGGHVSAFLSDMRAGGVSPDNETYRCAVRCATDAAMVDGARAKAKAKGRA